VALVVLLFIKAQLYGVPSKTFSKKCIIIKENKNAAEKINIAGNDGNDGGYGRV
jgi:hypothetical protein